MEADGDIGGTVTTGSPQAGVGDLLRARRLELAMSHADVAGIVKLPARRIAALEEERWEELPEGPYLRGFLRNVARALQLDAATLMERVDATRVRSRSPDSILVAPGATHATLPRRSGPIEGRHNGRALIYGAFAFALLAALIAWSGTASFDRAIDGGKALIAARSVGVAEAGGHGGTSPSEPTTSSKAVTEGTVAADGPLPTPAVAAQESSTDAATGAAAASPAAAGAATSAAPAADAALSFHFNEDSWVEVRAADGAVLLKDLSAAGSDRQIAGTAPFTLVIGNAKGVELTFRGKPVDLVPYTRAAVARLTLS